MEKIIVFGSGVYLTTKLDYLIKCADIVAVLDNYPSSDYYVLGDNKSIPICKPEAYENLMAYPVIIMTGKKYFYDIYRQLIGLGVNDSNIRFGINLDPAFDSAEELLHSSQGMIVSRNHQCYIDVDGREITIESSNDYIGFMNEFIRCQDPYIDILADMPVIPSCRGFGSERGKPIDRFYIESFLEENRGFIRGDVAEIGGVKYIKEYGHNLGKVMSFHVNGWSDSIKVNLETGEGVRDNLLDCLICTQTIYEIRDLKSVSRNIVRLLKDNGVALITVPGISQINRSDNKNWTDYWRFTCSSLRAIFNSSGASIVNVCSYGNVKTSICFLYGMCQDDLKLKDYEYNDPQYQLIVAAVVKK